MANPIDHRIVRDVDSSPTQTIITRLDSHASYEGTLFSDTTAIRGDGYYTRGIRVIGNGTLKYKDAKGTTHLIGGLFEGDMLPIQTDFVFLTGSTIDGLVLFY
jgi:hypothetical protein